MEHVWTVETELVTHQRRVYLSRFCHHIIAMQSQDGGSELGDESQAFDSNQELIDADSTHGQVPHHRRAAQILNGFLTLHSRTGLLKTYKPKWFVYR